ncbi:MAG: GNAT family N-acetyltransferase [Deltaproteobacteria bacterium]|jgi:predicted GNAT superfamily acetyltransferase|nr:GNAT family N-acetyltransferase [Deltaproteobacteria bacterium]
MNKIIEFKTKNNQIFEMITVERNLIENYLNEIAQFRIKYFKSYPYLYVGNLEYEKEYINGYANNSKSLLILALYNGKIIGVSTALPLNSNADILGEAPVLFAKKGLNINEYFYYGEIIVKTEFQGIGIAAKIYDMQESYAKAEGFKKIILATVNRRPNDPRKPSDYFNTDIVWNKLGFKKCNIQINYNWPTITENGSIKDINNPMDFWTKEIK